MKDNGLNLTKERSRGYPAHTITDAEYTDDIPLLAPTPFQAETLLYSLERAVAGIGLHVNADKIGYVCFNQRGEISSLICNSLKLMDKLTKLGSSVSSSEIDINARLAKSWAAIYKPSVIWKSDLSDTIKPSFFQAGVVSILPYGCTTWTLTKRIMKKLDGNYTRMLRAKFNKSWRQHHTKQQLYGHLLPITKNNKVRRTRHAGHCWRRRGELRGELQWTPSLGRAKTRWTARTYILQLCVNTGCSLEDLPGMMDDREGWRQWVREIYSWSATWWWMMTKKTLKILNSKYLSLQFIHLLQKGIFSGVKHVRMFWKW